MPFCGDLKFQKNIISLNLINVTIRTLILMLKNHLKNPIFSTCCIILFLGVLLNRLQKYTFFNKSSKIFFTFSDRQIALLQVVRFSVIDVTEKRA